MNAPLPRLSPEAMLLTRVKAAGYEFFEVKDRTSWLERRKQDVTASVIGCLLGLHEYSSAYSLWALKTGKITEDPEETPAMQRGRLLEPVAVALLKEKHPDWTIVPGRFYIRDPEARIGATPDVLVYDPKRGFGTVQVKSLGPGIFRSKWQDQETNEVAPPLWIACQAITEATLTCFDWTDVAGLSVGFGIDLHEVPVPVHVGVMDRLKAATGEFWKMVGEGRQPDPDYGRDSAILEAAFVGSAEIIDLTRDNSLCALIDEKASLAAQKTTIEKRQSAIKAEMLAKINAAVTNPESPDLGVVARAADGRNVVVKRANRDGHVVKPFSFIDLRIKKSA